MRGGSAGDRLARALRAVFEPYFVEVECDGLASRSWTSITFSGERHALRLTVKGGEAGAAADAFLDGLADREIPLAGHLLVDLAVVGEARDAQRCRIVLDLEAITVEAS